MTQAVDPAGVTLPYRFTLPGALVAGECVNDPDHSWIGMHNSWNGGANDNRLPAQVHQSVAGQRAVTMGFYTRRDSPIHYLPVDTFTSATVIFAAAGRDHAQPALLDERLGSTLTAIDGGRC